MQTSDFFNLLPAFIWWLIAIAFIVLWRIKLASWHCGIGFALTGTGFALDAYPTWGTFNPFLSGLCYIAAVHLYSGCVLHHFEVKGRSAPRLWLPVIFLSLHVYFLFGARSLQADLFLTDMVFACLFFHAIFVTAFMAINAADRFMLLSGGLVAADCVARSIVFTFILSSADQLAGFANSNYSVAVQITTVTIGVLFPISVLAAAATRVIERHRDVAEIDPLTGLLNRRGFLRLVHDSRSRGARAGALLLADIDHFKRVNDQHGHTTGDLVIKGLAAELRRSLGPTSIIARFGGEEFVAYLPGVAAADALTAAGSVNHEFGAWDWGHDGITTQITVSIGVTNVDEIEADMDTAVDRADKALYVAKEAGRNRVIVNVEQFHYHADGDQRCESRLSPVEFEKQQVI